MNYNVKTAQIYLFFLCSLLFFSCNKNERPDISQNKLEIKITRFDKDLLAKKNEDPAKSDVYFKEKYGLFYEDFINRMIGNGSLSGTEVLSQLYRGKAYADLSKQVDSVFPNLNNLEKELTETFKYIQYYYPKSKAPEFISFLSGFAYQIPVGDNYMGIGLDMFLGKDNPYYPALVESIPRYQTQRFEPKYILSRLTEEYAKQELFLPRDEDQTLLSQMIYQGKILYFMDQVLPKELNDTVKIGYTGRQLAWTRAFEGNIWAVLLENELLYKTDIQKIQVYLSDGPFTSGLGDKGESAPKLGIWLGWQIVKKYMEENPEVTLQYLMAEQDAQKILNKSRYKPKIKEG